MLRAELLSPRPNDRAAGKPDRMELVTDGNKAIFLNENAMSFQIGEKTFKITRKGFFGPNYQLCLGEDLVVSLAQTPCFNRYSAVTFLGMVGER